MVKKLFVGLFLCLVIYVDRGYAGADVNMQEGMWEITSQVKMQGMAIPPVTFSQCITKDNLVPREAASEQDACTVNDMQTIGDTISWTIACKGQGGDMKSKGNITYHGDRFEGEVTTEHMGMMMVTEMHGRRTGPCQ